MNKTGIFFKKLLKKAIPIVIGIILKKQKFNKTSKDEQRIDDFIHLI